MSDIPLYLHVALPVPLAKLFDYLPPETASRSMLQTGMRVRVPFGPREMTGVIIAFSDHSDAPKDKLKSALEILDTRPCLDPEIIELCHWAADYYHHPLGEVISAALPKPYRMGKAQQQATETVWSLTTAGKALPEDGLKRSKKQQRLFQYLLEHKDATESTLENLELRQSVIKAMESKGLIKKEQRQKAETLPAEALLAEPIASLNAEQQSALNAIRYHQFQCSLLHGVTGSGKTEVYMQAIARVLQTGKQALVLIPEIGLSPQTLKRFHQRFNVEIAELHSRVGENARAHHWQRVRDGYAQIIIGTRLAALSPIKHLGIIIIDEEHDASFKQQDGFRYSARDLSIYRASRRQIPIILGSATPSLESLQNAYTGKYQHLRLTQRAGTASSPSMQSLDITNTRLTAGLSDEAIEQIRNTLKDGKQALVFLNRRGYAPLLYCHCCGWTARCASCELNFTYHQHSRQLRCHICDQKRPLPALCPNCKNRQLTLSGTGTEQTCESLQKAFPEVTVLRIDRDTTQGKDAMSKALQEINKGEACILVGTQMLAKGHHLEALKLVVVVNTDQGLMSPDFKAAERMGQLIVQVAGRAGRGNQQKGMVILQSYQPDHPWIQVLINQGYEAFAKELLTIREKARLPPFSYCALLRAESKRQENAIELLQLAKKVHARGQFKAQVARLGPLPSALEKVNHRYRYQMQFTCPRRDLLHKTIEEILQVFDNNALSKRVRWSIDIDPLDY